LPFEDDGASEAQHPFRDDAVRAAFAVVAALAPRRLRESGKRPQHKHADERHVSKSCSQMSPIARDTSTSAFILNRSRNTDTALLAAVGLMRYVRDRFNNVSAVAGLAPLLFMRGPMRHRVLSTAFILLVVVASEANAEQTIVFFRHGEKPSGGYGQITCQGLNRALALPTVLSAKYGTPTYLYAPNPAVKVPDPAGSFSYVRPLATIEPTAVRLGMPVNTKYGYSDIASLQAALITPTKDNSTTFVAWEHAQLVKIVQNIMNKYGGGAVVPAWTSGDYDSLYVLRVDYVGGTITAQFHRDYELLNGQPTACPY
jgi:hypothetical protein